MRSVRLARLLPGFFVACAISVGTPLAAQAPTPACDIQIYPADGVHSVGEDFDAVHARDRDLAHYYEVAGRPLNWLSPQRQLEILRDMHLGALAGVSEQALIVHDEPVTRREALQERPQAASHGCTLEVLVPQIMLERGGLSNRSARVFGVVRLYRDGALARTYSSYAAAGMDGFQLKSPADADAATAIVEEAYRGAVETLLRNFANQKNQ